MKIVARHIDRKRWNLERLAQDEGEDMALAEQGLAGWADALDLSADRVALQRALLASQEDVEAGRLVDAEEVLRELRSA